MKIYCQVGETFGDRVVRGPYVSLDAATRDRGGTVWHNEMKRHSIVEMEEDENGEFRDRRLVDPGDHDLRSLCGVVDDQVIIDYASEHPEASGAKEAVESAKRAIDWRRSLDNKIGVDESGGEG